MRIQATKSAMMASPVIEVAIVDAEEVQASEEEDPRVHIETGTLITIVIKMVRKAMTPLVSREDPAEPTTTESQGRDAPEGIKMAKRSRVPTIGLVAPTEAVVVAASSTPGE